MILLLLDEMTDQLSYLVAPLHRGGVQTTLVNDVVTASESLY
jgi:hypothetical protein